MLLKGLDRKRGKELEMSTKHTLFTGSAKRVNGWWVISIDGLDSAHAQVRCLDKTEDSARDLVAHLLDVPSDSFGVGIGPELTDPERLALERTARGKRTTSSKRGRSSVVSARPPSN
jgi:hypothetical protein